MTECRNCDGTGRIEWFDSAMDIEPMESEPCPVCGGTGTVETATFASDAQAIEPGDLEYCVRDKTGRIVVAWRPVGDIVAAIVALDTAAQLIDYGEDEGHEPARTKVAGLLGIGRGFDAEQ